VSRATLFVFVLSTALSCGGGSPATPSPSPIPGATGWTLVFADEFDAAGPLNPLKWGYETGYIRNSEKQYYTSRA
jgi:hypothetical protein